MTSPTPADTRHNFRLGVLNGLSFTLAETLIDPTLVLVAFVSTLTQSPLLIGLVTPLRDGAWYLPQVWVSGFLQSQPHKLAWYRLTGAVRMLAWLLLVWAMVFINDPGWLLLAFFVFFGSYAFFSGLGGLSFMEVVSKTVPPHRRAEFFAWRLILGGGASIAASLLVRWLVDKNGPLPFPYNFAVLAGLGCVLAYMGVILFAEIREPADVHVRPVMALNDQLKRAQQALTRDARYRQFILLRIWLMVAGAGVPFFAVYIQNHMQAPLDMVGVYLAAYNITHFFSNVGLGRFAYRLGNQRVMLLAAVSGLSMTALMGVLLTWDGVGAVSGTLAAWWLVPVFALSGIRESGIGVSAQAMLMDIAPAEERSLYLGFTNSLLGVVLLSTGLSGVVVAVLGFPTLLLVSLVAGGLAVVTAWHVTRVHAMPTVR